MVWPLVAMLAASAVKAMNDKDDDKHREKLRRHHARTAPFGGIQPGAFQESDAFRTMQAGFDRGLQAEQAWDGLFDSAGEAPDDPQAYAGDVTKPPGNQTSPWVASSYTGRDGEVTPQTSQTLPNGSQRQAPMDYGDHLYRDIFPQDSKVPMRPETTPPMSPWAAIARQRSPWLYR